MSACTCKEHSPSVLTAFSRFLAVDLGSLGDMNNASSHRFGSLTPSRKWRALGRGSFGPLGKRSLYDTVGQLSEDLICALGIW